MGNCLSFFFFLLCCHEMHSNSDCILLFLYRYRHRCHCGGVIIESVWTRPADVRNHPRWFRSAQRHRRAGSFGGGGGLGVRVEKTPGDAFRNGLGGGRVGVWTGTGQFVWVGTNENKWSDKVERLRSRLRDPPPLSIFQLGRLMRAENSHLSVSFTPWGLWTRCQWCAAHLLAC